MRQNCRTASHLRLLTQFFEPAACIEAGEAILDNRGPLSRDRTQSSRWDAEAVPKRLEQLKVQLRSITTQVFFSGLGGDLRNDTRELYYLVVSLYDARLHSFQWPL